MVIVMVIYGIDLSNSMSIPWIYGVYKDHKFGFLIMKELEENEDYKHLTWMNNLLELNENE